MYDQLQLRELVQRDPRYKIEAYYYVLETLDFARSELRMGRPVEQTADKNGPAEEEADEPEETSSHITGQELCEAIRVRSAWMFGYMAKTVLNRWGIHTTDDVGEIVYNMVNERKIRVTTKDRREDFHEVFDFQKVFCDDFRIQDEEVMAEMIF